MGKKMTNYFSSVQRFFSIWLKNKLERLPWRMLELKYQLASELKLSIKNRADWNTYNEIFVRGDYNWAIDKSLQGISEDTKTFRFFDLGANVGFFSLKVIDSILQMQSVPIKFEGVLIEGSPRVFKELQNRLTKTSIENIELKLIHGLAGKRTGRARIYESSNYITNSLSSSSTFRKNLSGTMVSYVDIGLLNEQENEIDLLKCDIEGSELEFLENYKELLPKIKIAVFEMHHDKCDTKKCLDIIHKSGLINQKTVFTYGDSCSLEIFWK